jgi:hypothetical protein
MLSLAQLMWAAGYVLQVVRELLQRGGMEPTAAASAAAMMLSFHGAVLELKRGKAPGLTEVSCSLTVVQIAHAVRRQGCKAGSQCQRFHN